MTNLRIPGPTPCPDIVLKEMGRQMINHRGPEFKKYLYDVTDKLKQVFKTKNDVFILTGSGTGGGISSTGAGTGAGASGTVSRPGKTKGWGMGSGGRVASVDGETSHSQSFGHTVGCPVRW